MTQPINQDEPARLHIAQATRQLTAHQAKRLFRSLLPVFAGYWYDARDNAPVDSLNASLWPDYVRLLRTCQCILDTAPMHPNEARQINVEGRFTRALELLANTLAMLFPCGFVELESYIVTEAIQERFRQRGLTRYRNRKQRRKGGRR